MNAQLFILENALTAYLAATTIKLYKNLSLVSPFCCFLIFFDSEKVEFSHYIIVFVCLLINCLVLEDCFCFFGNFC